MTPIQQLMLGVGAKKKTFIDDVFSTYAYEGTGSAITINNGLDLATEGGLVWTRRKDSTANNELYDTIRGVSKALESNSNGGTSNQGVYGLSSFNTNGYTASAGFSSSTVDYVSWSFRKSPGFFDIQEYSSGSSNTSGSIGNPNFIVNHSLGSMPGMIIIKRTNGSADWFVWVKGKEGALNSNSSLGSASALPLANVTSTYFKFAQGNSGYNDPNNYIAYIFAGGESNASEARSVDFDGSGDALTTSTSSDYTFGTGDFTVEHWINTGSTAGATSVIDARTDYSNNWTTYLNTDFTYNFYSVGANRIVSTPLGQGTWNHVALCRSSGTTTLYLNGIAQGTYSDSNNYTNTTLKIGLNFANAHALVGGISNFRVVKGTAVYTSSFKPPTEPLTNITNTKLLCCNNSSVTGTTVGTVTSSGNPTASTDSPFVDPAGLKFGDAGDQNVIKCGSYTGNHTTKPEINLGFEPQWLLIKNTNLSTEPWYIFDSIRGIITDGTDYVLEASSYNQENGWDLIDLTPTGFKIKSNDDKVNNNNGNYIYMVIRRPDPLVQKPQLATDVFAMDVGNSSAGMPNFDSGFPVDYALLKQFNGSSNTHSLSRLTGPNYMNTTQNIAEQSYSNFQWDNNEGWYDGGFHSSGFQSWMWKRSAGFDCTTYQGTNANRSLPHSLNKIPELIIIKKRNAAGDWIVYHPDLNGGTNFWRYVLYLNGEGTEDYVGEDHFRSAPTSTHINLGSHVNVNGADSNTYIAMLFASVDGISKIGSYTGDDTDDGSHEINVGFTPRFLMIKSMNNGGGWYIYDTNRGFSSSANSLYLRLNEPNAQYGTSFNSVRQTSTGFNLYSPAQQFNAQGTKILYYAHA